MSEESAQSRLQAIDREQEYQFTGAQLEEALLESAGAVSHVFLVLDGDLTMPTGQVFDAVDQWAVSSPEMIAGALQRAGGVVTGTTAAGPVPDELLDAEGLFERKAAVCSEAALASTDRVQAEAFSEAAEWFRRQAKGEDPEGPYPESEPSSSTQPQFAVHDEVEVSGHHEHVLPPVLETEGVKLPIHGKVVRTSPDDPGFIGVEVELPSPIGTTVVRLHVDQVELEAPSA